MHLPSARATSCTPYPLTLEARVELSGPQVVLSSVTHSTGKHPEWKLEAGWHGRIISQDQVPSLVWKFWDEAQGREDKGD